MRELAAAFNRVNWRARRALVLGEGSLEVGRQAILARENRELIALPG